MERRTHRRSAGIPNQRSYLQQLGYQQPTFCGQVLSLVSGPAPFLILLKGMVLWVGYTIVENHIAYMDAQTQPSSYSQQINRR